MTIRILIVLVLSIVFGSVAPASAQGPYVAASLVGDIVRLSNTDTGSSFDVSSGGEAIGWAIRVGTPIGAAWGVEAEFARPSEIERDTGEIERPPLPSLPATVPVDLISLLPSFSYRARTRERNVTLSTGLWVQQTLSQRVAIVYHGGVGFVRSERSIEFTFTPSGPFPPIALPPTQAESIIYGVRPFVGVESPIVLAGRAYLVPGIRLHGIDGGWLVRPSVGIGWNF